MLMQPAPEQQGVTEVLPRSAGLASRRWEVRVLALLALACAGVIYVLYWPPVPQNPEYHNFADQRTVLGVPNFYNVVSNFAFVIVGLLGLWYVLAAPCGPSTGFQHPAERWFFMLFFLGVFLTAFGSAYYHLQPDNDRLFWDRLPMSLAFTSLFAALLAERINLKLGLWLLPVLVTAGVASSLYWAWTERQGRGDLRFYYLAQFFPLAALPVLLLAFPPRYTRTIDLLVALGWYVVAKVCEMKLDQTIYDLRGLVSGHTLKHLAAALSAYWVLLWIRRRVAVPYQFAVRQPSRSA
jgi:hypothetical protein